MTLGQTIQMLRLAAGWSQEQLAEQLSVTRQTVSKWERDLSAPDVNAILLLSDMFEISLDDLLRGGEPQQSSRALDLEQLAAKNRRNHRRAILAIIGAVSAVSGGLSLVFLKALDVYVARLQYMLYRYMTVGEYVYQHEGFVVPMAAAAGVLALGLLLLLCLLWKRTRT